MSDKPKDAEPRWEELVNDFGLTPYNRRLADKILNAYNQSIALERSQVSELLLQALHATIASDADNRNEGALAKASLWQEFVAARNSYKKVREAHEQSDQEVLAALEVMKKAYNAWSEA
ncbi:MAG: hypothetical protein RIM84_12605 [Alphaproteobacteria bacterium]